MIESDYGDLVFFLVACALSITGSLLVWEGAHLFAAWLRRFEK